MSKRHMFKQSRSAGNNEKTIFSCMIYDVFHKIFKDIDIYMVSEYCQPNKSIYVKSVIPESINDEIRFILKQNQSLVA